MGCCKYVIRSVLCYICCRGFGNLKRKSSRRSKYENPLKIFLYILSHPLCLICLLALSNAHAATHKANCILLNLYMSMCVCASVAFNSMYLIRYVSFVIMHAIASVAYKLLFRVRMWVPFTDVHRQTKRFFKKKDMSNKIYNKNHAQTIVEN